MNWIKELFGLKPECEHKWSKWEVMSAKSSNYGQYKFVQLRTCSNCGLSQFKTTSC